MNPREANPEAHESPPSLGAPVDWSSLMTDILKSLTKAEESLRLIHMDPKYKHKAVAHLQLARADLIILERWCHEN